MEHDDVVKMLKDAGLVNAAVFAIDSSYAKPTTSWLTGKFYEYYSNWLDLNGLSQWRAKWDCDNFSSSYYTFAQACHVASNRPEEGLTVGELFYRRDIDGAGHAIIVAITDEGVIFIEPQDGKEFQLSVKEKASCPLVRM
jgi:hypothetical protein